MGAGERKNGVKGVPGSKPGWIEKKKIEAEEAQDKERETVEGK